MVVLQIREAHASDVEGILRCLQAAFAGYKNLYTPEAFADTVLDSRSLEARMQKMRVLVAVSGDQIIGTVSGANCGDGEGHLRGMAVLPAHQGTGVARDLLAAIERWLKANGCSRVTLDTTLPLQPAMNFYERNGYRKSERITDFFGMTLIEYTKAL